jgi:DGQHR domain-containing protein
MSKQTLKFDALLAEQGTSQSVAMIRATASQILRIASIERLGRDAQGRTIGFQRPQIARHIAEIRDYLEAADAVLPNCVVLAFVGDARIVAKRGSGAVLEVDVKDQPVGYVVDGQQRLTALSQTGREDFQVFASCLICRDMKELRRQFILINNTKQLAKSLIYELLPGMDELPERLTSRALAAALTEKLNFDPSSSLRKAVKTQTNPTGVIKDTALQKAILNSEAAGAVQIVMSGKDDVGAAFELMNNFFAAVQVVFPEAWHGHKPATSRLVHGAGITALGYVMDEIYARSHATSKEAFVDGLAPLIGRTAWTEGHWKFGDGEVVSWNHIENTPRQIQQLAEHLVSIVRTAHRSPRSASKRKAA